MSKSNDESDDVTRLIDMVVEEVSLVDRAANQRRFLLVKRSEAMDPTDDDINEGAEDAEDTDLEGEATGDDGGTEAGDATDAASAPTGASTEAVVAALEALSGVVKVLANQNVTKAKKPPAPPIDDEEDLEDGGVDEEEEGDDSPTQDQPPPSKRPPPKKKTKAHGGALADVLARLTRIEAALPRRPAKKQESPAPNSVVARLADIAKKIDELKTQVAGQAGRLSKVEKNVGLPASKPIDGARGKRTDEVSWPLDINAPRDRESVDDDVSFH